MAVTADTGIDESMKPVSSDVSKLGNYDLILSSHTHTHTLLPHMLSVSPSIPTCLTLTLQL